MLEYVELQLLDIGHDGHIGFNEPEDYFPTIMTAKKIVTVVTGDDKRDILKKTFWGPVDPQVPASILKFHPDVTLVCD